MPYLIKKVKTGYKVCLAKQPTKCFSKQGIPKSRAIKQRKAIAISENKRKGKK